jgi:hypothetical protein
MVTAQERAGVSSETVVQVQRQQSNFIREVVAESEIILFSTGSIPELGII